MPVSPPIVIPPPPASPFDTLLGTWRLTRTIPGHARAHGLATVHLHTHDEARYHEQVTLQLLSGQVLQGSATYLFRRLPQGLAIHFAHTGQLFHDLRFLPDSHADPQASLIAQATHHCSADCYHSAYRIHPSGTVEIEHRVLGPHKDYLSHTILTHA